MDNPSFDVARLLLSRMNITTKKNLALTNRYWWILIKRRILTCSSHTYHCKLCISRLNNGAKCCNDLIFKCYRCNKTFCKHLKNKKCKQCNKIYDKNYNLCGFCPQHYCSEYVIF